MSVDRLQVTSNDIKTILKHKTNTQYIYYILVYIYKYIYKYTIIHVCITLNLNVKYILQLQCYHFTYQNCQKLKSFSLFGLNNCPDKRRLLVGG